MAVSVTVNQSVIDNLFSENGRIGVNVYSRALRVQRRAKQLCPVDTGRLRSSIQATFPRREGTEITSTIGTNVEYAIFVHNGTRFMRARPFLRDALQRET